MEPRGAIQPWFRLLKTLTTAGLGACTALGTESTRAVEVFGKLEDSRLGFGRRLGQEAKHLAQHNAEHFSQSMLQPPPARTDGVRGGAHRFRDKRPPKLVYPANLLFETVTHERPCESELLLAEHDAQESFGKTEERPTLQPLVLGENKERILELGEALAREDREVRVVVSAI